MYIGLFRSYIEAEIKTVQAKKKKRKEKNLEKWKTKKPKKTQEKKNYAVVPKLAVSAKRPRHA